MGLPSFIWDEPSAEPAQRYLANSIRHLTSILEVKESKGPITLAIYGRWGAGKTTTLRQIEEQLSSAGAVTVWFEPWRYEREPNLMVPLLTEMTSSVVERHGISAKAKEALVKTGYRLLGRVAKAGFRATSAFVAGQIGVESKDLEQLGEEFMRHYEDSANRFEYPKSERQQFMEDFESMIRIASTKKIKGALSDPNAKPVCVLIDDLDRCDPEKVKSLLESMKNFMWVPGVTYALALDRDQVTTAVAEPFQKIFKSYGQESFILARERARAYLEKFFLISFDIDDDSAGFLSNVVHPAKANMFNELQDTLPYTIKGHNLWDKTSQLYYCADDNLRHLKRVLRWLYMTLHIEVLSTTQPVNDSDMRVLNSRFAETVLAESFPEIWLDILDQEKAPVRAKVYYRIVGILSLFASFSAGRFEYFYIDDDFRDMLEALLRPSEDEKLLPPEMMLFVRRRSGAYIAAIIQKQDIRSVQSLFTLASDAAHISE